MVLQTKNTVVFILASFLILTACGNDRAITTVVFDPQKMPTIHGEYVNSLISDSGVTRYRMEAEVWDMYSNIPKPYWHFPRGVYVEQFDSLFNVVGSVEADTAYFYEDEELWHLIGNIFIRNLEGDTFETSELFWNQQAPAESDSAVYTEKNTRIIQGSDTTISRGLRANQTLTRLRMMDVGAKIWVKDQPADSIQSESPKAELPAPTPVSVPAPISTSAPTSAPANDIKRIQPTKQLEKPIEK